MVQTSLGKVKIPVNPVTPSSQAIIMSQESLSCRNGQTVKSYMLHLSVTCHLQQNVDSIHNGLCNGESGKFIYYKPIKDLSFNCLFSGHLIQRAGSTNGGFPIPYHYPLKRG